MASPVTRSSRRSEGLTTRSATRNNVAARQGNHHSVYNNHQQPNVGRRKHPRDALDNEEQLISTKKANIAIDLDTRPKAQPKTRSLVIKSNANSKVVVQHFASPKQ